MLTYSRRMAHTLGTQRGLDFLIPLATEPIPEERLDWKTRILSFVRFDHGWAEGLRQLLRKLVAINCPRPVDDGRGVAAATLLRRDLVTVGCDLVLSNCLVIQKIPTIVWRFNTTRDVSGDTLKDLQSRWAYHKVSPRQFLSFRHPPAADIATLGLVPNGGANPHNCREIDGCSSANLISELVRKTMIVKCIERGLRWCPEKNQLFFPANLVLRDRLNFVRPDGMKSFVNSVGQRKYWQPKKSVEYRYSLSPTFAVPQVRDGPAVVLVRIRVYVTDTQDKPLSRRQTVSRRKHLCKGWWNDDWLHRMLAVCQFLAEGGPTITIGDAPDEQVVVSAYPRHWETPIKIDEDALDKGARDRDEALLPQTSSEVYDEEEDDDDDLDD